MTPPFVVGCGAHVSAAHTAVVVVAEQCALFVGELCVFVELWFALVVAVGALCCECPRHVVGLT